MPLSMPEAFADVPDPRLDRNKLHALTDIPVVALCGVIGGAETWEQVAEYGRRKADFFRRLLPLANGVPSHDTFYRVFCALDPTAFAAAFGRWMAAACERTGLTPVAVDGKSVRGSKRGTFSGCLHLVTAWATANGVALGQVSVADGSHEIAAVPDLLRVLDLNGAIVTLDAAGCQTENARLIREGGGHYLLAVKGNQPGLEAAVQGAFERACDAGFVGVEHDTHVVIEDGHGRHEERCVTVLPAPAGLPGEWAGAAAVVQVCRERVVGGVRTSTTHYYLTSYAGTAGELAGFVRGHWGIENGLHWVLDVAFREDQSRTRAGHAGANLGVLRRAAVSLLKQAAGRGSIQTRRLMAAWDDEFLLAVLQGISKD